MIVWPVTRAAARSSTNSRIALISDGQPSETLTGVRITRNASDRDLEPEAAQARPALGLEVLALVLDRPSRWSGIRGRARDGRVIAGGGLIGGRHVGHGLQA